MVCLSNYFYPLFESIYCIIVFKNLWCHTISWHTYFSNFHVQIIFKYWNIKEFEDSKAIIKFCITSEIKLCFLDLKGEGKTTETEGSWKNNIRIKSKLPHSIDDQTSRLRWREGHRRLRQSYRREGRSGTHHRSYTRWDQLRIFENVGNTNLACLFNVYKQYIVYSRYNEI